MVYEETPGYGPGTCRVRTPVGTKMASCKKAAARKEIRAAAFRVMHV